MKNRIAVALVAVVLASGCSQVVNTDSVEYNYRHEIELQTSNPDTAQKVVDELRERHENLGLKSNIGLKPNQSTENIRYYIETVNNSGPAIEASISEMSFSANMPFVVQDSRTLDLGENVEITRNGDQVTVDGETLSQGETLEVQNYTLRLNSTDSGKATVDVEMLENSHIGTVTERTLQAGRSGFTGRIRAALTEEGSDRMTTVLSNYNSSDEGTYLRDITGENARLKTVVQGEYARSLFVSEDLKQRTQTFAVSVTGSTESEVREKLNRYEAVLDSSELATEIEYVDVERINTGDE